MAVKETDNILYIIYPKVILQVIVLRSCAAMVFSDHAQVCVFAIPNLFPQSSVQNDRT